jgi:DNA-directed RNA polymerase omega subunit
MNWLQLLAIAILAVPVLFIVVKFL